MPASGVRGASVMNPAAHEINVMVGKVLSSKKRPSADWVAGVYALANALKSIKAEPPPKVPHPYKGLAVRCPRQKCDLVVTGLGTAERTQKRSGKALNPQPCLYIEVDVRRWRKNPGPRQNDKPSRRLWLSTWRRWTGGGRVLEDVGP